MPAPAMTSEAKIVTAARSLLERQGPTALTMRAIAAEVGVKGPSLYKRVPDRNGVLRLVLDEVADELTAALDAAASTGDAVSDLRAMTSAFRHFAFENPAAYALLFSPDPMLGSEARAQQSSATLLARMADLVGPDDALPAARTLVAWAHGFVTMELSGAFHLGGDPADAWAYGLERILDALRQQRPGRDTAPDRRPGAVTRARGGS